MPSGIRINPSALPVAFKYETGDYYFGFESYKVTTAKGLEKLSIDPQAQRDDRDLKLYYGGWNKKFDDESLLNVEGRGCIRKSSILEISLLLLPLPKPIVMRIF